MPDHFESLLTGLKTEDRREIATIPEKLVKRALDGDWDGVAELLDGRPGCNQPTLDVAIGRIRRWQIAGIWAARRRINAICRSTCVPL